MSFRSFVDTISDTINDGIRNIAKSGTIPKVVGKTTRIGLNTGKRVGKAGFTVGMFGLNTGLDAANFVKDNYKSIFNAVTDEAGTFTRAAGGALELFDRTFLKEAPLSKSLIGRSFNKKGLALMAGVALASGTTSATKDYIQSRQGYNDGQIYRPTPQMSTPYMLSQQMAYSQHGRSFADNAGATGDLVFALNDSRHG